MGHGGLAASRKEKSIEARPSSRRIAPWRKAQDEHPEEEQQEQQVEPVEVDDGVSRSLLRPVTVAAPEAPVQRRHEGGSGGILRAQAGLRS